MSDQTANLQFPFVMPAQAQKHVTVNECLLRLDALVQLGVVSATTTAQPASPADGAVYILPAGKTGAAWGAMANLALAYFRDGAWEQITPREGFVAFVKDTNTVLVYDGAIWTGPQYFSINAEPLSVAYLETYSETAVHNLLCWKHFEGEAPPTVQFRKARGTKAAPGAVLANDRLGGFFFHGYHSGGAFGVNAAAFQFHAAENFTATAQGTYFALALTANGAAARAERLRVEGDGTTRPGADNTQNLGTASFRWATVFAGTGTINTSDAREKTPLQPIPDSVKRAVRRVIAQIGVFQWLDAVARKGPDHARKHVGVTAQIVRDAFLAEGEDPARWGLFCEDPVFAQRDSGAVDDEGAAIATTVAVLDANGAQVTRLGVRADQLMWLALAAAAA